MRLPLPLFHATPLHSPPLLPVRMLFWTATVLTPPALPMAPAPPGALLFAKVLLKIVMVWEPPPPLTASRIAPFAPALLFAMVLLIMVSTVVPPMWSLWMAPESPRVVLPLIVLRSTVRLPPKL